MAPYLMRLLLVVSILNSPLLAQEDSEALQGEDILDPEDTSDTHLSTHDGTATLRTTW